MASIGKRAVEALAIATVYVGTAQPGFLIAIAPGNVTVVWPPSGIALAAMLLLGYRAGAGVWLGSFLVNLLFFISNHVVATTAVATAGGIATGSMLQAFLAALLYRRMIGAHIPSGPTAIFGFVTIAASSCLIAATVGVSSQAFGGATAWTSYADTWLTWWLGDLVGILTIAPVLLVVGYRSRRGQGLKYLTFPLTSGAAGLALIAGYNIWKLGDNAVAAYLGVSPAWLSWGVFATGLLLAVSLASYIEYYLGVETALRESEERSRRQLLELQTVYRTAPIGLALLDRDLRFLRINDKLAEIDGVPVDAHIGRTLREVVPSMADTIEPLYRHVIETGQSVLEVEVHGTTAAQPGIERDWLVDYYPMKNPDDSVQAVAAIVSEITGRKRAEEALRLSEQRFRDFAMSASDWLWETDADHRFIWFSPNVKDLVGVSPEWHYGKTRREIMAPGVDRELVEAHWQVLEAHLPFHDLEYLRRGPDGDAWLSASGMPIFDEAGRFRGYRGVGRNISVRKSVEAELAHLAHHDGLTTLANRHALGRQLEQALSLATRQQRLGALLLFDLDHFKEVNDAHGHIAGDQLLRMVGEPATARPSGKRHLRALRGRRVCRRCPRYRRPGRGRGSCPAADQAHDRAILRRRRRSPDRGQHRCGALSGGQ